MSFRRGLTTLWVLSITLGALPASAQSSADHSENIVELAEVRGISQQVPSYMWDAGFEDDLLVAAVDLIDVPYEVGGGSGPEGFVAFETLPKAPYLKRTAFYRCGGVYMDLAVWQDLVFLGVPVRPDERSEERRSSSCNNTNNSLGKGGLRIVDVSDPTRPKQVGFVATNGGLQRVTLLPHRGRLLVYGAQYAEGAPAAGGLDVISVDPDEPAEGRLVSRPSVVPLLGCIEFVILESRKLGACIDQRQFALFDLEDPYHPRMIGTPTSIQESPQLGNANFTWDGQHLVIADAGANTGFSTCGIERVNALWIYNIENPAAPEQVGAWVAPRAGVVCFPGNFNVLPTKDGRYLMTVGTAGGGMSVVDFTDPSSPREVGYYSWDGGDPSSEPTYTSYWHNGRIYALQGRVAHVLRMQGTGRHKVHYFRRRNNPQTQIEDFR